MKNKLCEEFGIQGVAIRLIIRDIDYKKEKKRVEKQQTLGKTLKQMFLRRRRLGKMARIKLERLNQKLKK